MAEILYTLGLVVVTIVILLILFSKGGRRLMTNKKFILFSLVAGGIIALSVAYFFSKKVGLQFGLSQFLSVLFLMVVGSLVWYFYWKRSLVPIYKNPRENAYHEGDLKWIIIMIIVILIIFLIAAIMFDFF